MALAQLLLEDDVRLVSLRGGIGAVPGVRLAGVHAGIKTRKRDLALIAFDAPNVCASVVTTNEIKAAPVTVSAGHLAQSGGAMRALVCNSGCANACTGERGERDAHATARQAAALLEILPAQVVIASTGVIGVPLPMDKVQRGIERAFAQLENGGKAAHDAAEAIMTTDRVPKLAAYSFYHEEKKYVVGGIAKGSGMIAPNMATMLAFVATDLPMSQNALATALSAGTDESFNMISVDGDMSTNDAVYAFAPVGESEPPLAFVRALRQVCLDLALAMVADGEGATKTLTVHVTGALDVAQARTIGRAIINSNLVKTALYGEDPNWGRIIAAAGSARAGLDATAWSLVLNEKMWVEIGAIEALSEVEAHRELELPEIVVELRLGLGDARATAWGCDLSKDYVRINASYRT
ncbi:MAG TPA: bifunctional glutamate N-acetyltransferase/amino-acid acetyltransferase ArgJ [Candidatus Baltobacteraceae bacterium]|nr:bifunctional glutamate N-acetyltransferase/amino-acid acetyltransferase ArgJ [Candidatus Baltobacteraceae bacterium]